MHDYFSASLASSFSFRGLSQKHIRSIHCTGLAEMIQEQHTRKEEPLRRMLKRDESINQIDKIT